MTKEQSARAFERFYRADPSGHILGAGLGLSIVQEIVELHHGKVELHSNPGAGTQVTIWLPLKAAPANDLAAGRPAARPASAGPENLPGIDTAPAELHG
jgi:signal transduction histidine kinase